MSRKFIINKKISNKGFTIMEVLVVIAVIGVIGYVLTDLLARSFSGSNKTSLIGNIKQSGQVAMDLMVKDIRTADNVVCSGSDVITIQENSLSAENRLKYIRYKFIISTSSDPDYIQVDYPLIDSAIDQANYCITDSSHADYIDHVNARYLTDNNSGSNVTLDSGSFDVSTDHKLVTINFSLKPIGSGSGFAFELGDGGTMKFNTSVQLR